MERLKRVIEDQCSSTAWEDGKLTREGKEWCKENLKPICKKHNITSKFSSMADEQIEILLDELNTEQKEKTAVYHYKRLDAEMKHILDSKCDGVWVPARDVRLCYGNAKAAIMWNQMHFFGRNIQDSEGGWFFFTSKKQKEMTGLGRCAQQTAVEHLIKLGLVEREKRGKRWYYRLNYTKYRKMINERDLGG